MKMGSPYVVGRFGIAVFLYRQNKVFGSVIAQEDCCVKNVYQQD